MASKGFSKGLSALRAFGGSKDPLTQCLAPRLSRTMATETALPTNHQDSQAHTGVQNTAYSQTEITPSTVLTTIYQFPTMEPLRFESYSSKHLYLPLRRDLLHRAVIFEGDASRQGTGSTKTRWEIHGSHRKIRPQKGSGMARLGTKQSPMLRGGSKAFGPKPRDFSTELPRKMYDLAWRTALSWRYRKGDLIVCEDGMDIESEVAKMRYMKRVFEYNRWGKEDGRSLVITDGMRKNLFKAMGYGEGADFGKVMEREEVDVKDLLESGRIIIEKSALEGILREHQSDLEAKIRSVV